MAEPVFVAPHFDDVALSCGATVAIRARNENPLVITVFAEGPDSDKNVSAFAGFQHSRWELDDLHAVERRMAEDLCAASVLGDTVQNRYLHFADAIYRNNYYDADERLFGEIPDFDTQLIDEIAGELAEFNASEYFVPLAIGGHVDHRIVSQAGKILASRGRAVLAYEDLPYALSLPKLKVLTPAGSTVTVNVDDEALDRKWAAISCYESQLPVIFRDIASPRDRFERYAKIVGDGSPAERFWSF